MLAKNCEKMTAESASADGMGICQDGEDSITLKLGFHWTL